MGSHNFAHTSRHNLGLTFFDCLGDYEEFRDEFDSEYEYHQFIRDCLNEQARTFSTLCEILNRHFLTHLTLKDLGIELPYHIDPSPSFYFSFEHGYHDGFRLLIDSEYDDASSDDVGTPYMDDVAYYFDDDDYTPEQNAWHEKQCTLYGNTLNDFCHYCLKVVAECSPYLSHIVGGYCGGYVTPEKPTSDEHERFHAHFMNALQSAIRFFNQFSSSYGDEIHALGVSGLLDYFNKHSQTKQVG